MAIGDFTTSKNAKKSSVSAAELIHWEKQTKKHNGKYVDAVQARLCLLYTSKYGCKGKSPAFWQDWAAVTTYGAGNGPIR